MSRLEQLEQQISALDEVDRKALREWFDRSESEAWDLRVESDAKSGKLARLAEQALKDHRSGVSTEI